MKDPEPPEDEVLSQDEAQELRERLRSPRAFAKGADCPDEEQLQLLAAGLIPEAATHSLLEHATTCVWCGNLLRETAEDLESPPTAEELSLASTSRLANPRKRRDFAEHLAAASRPTPLPIPTPRWRLWGAAAAMAAAIATGGIFVWSAGAVARTELLLARAYTEYRPMEMRLPGAAWGPLRIERAAGAPPPISRSPELYEAEARILRQVESHPDDPQWLHLQGRVHLLEGREDSAIAELDRARSLRPADATILGDLGAAYFQKAEKTGDDPKLYSAAFEALSEGTRLKPDDPVLVFNKALAAEHIYALAGARDAWEHYLQLDRNSRWAAEARDRLERVKKNSTGNANTAPSPAPAH